MFDVFESVEVSSLENLHAKVYITDSSRAVITSANLTGGGIFNNFEYGVLLEGGDIVSSMYDDLERYFTLGNLFDKPFLSKIADEVERIELPKKEKRQDAAGLSKFLDLQKSHIEKINTDLLRNRVKGQRTVSGIFSNTVLYLLGKYGDLTTTQLHEYIQDMHPDICDDTIDRVINGQHFGKRWKHLVRGAQQHLKRQGRIVLEKDVWKLRV